ncbi:MAG: hypothetical protein AVDCRST_MAG33-2058 [uncultured Thermomicrobiales bacterium]|uniref:Uncharacterized protein n=1 Tax=uncultured Thermomicrobiales bacterium TaxID=1645740 RepID=A0A6J4V5J0_9BACT|nr:MAG: hypothetical protein AVDCRST_MAG33-2058 [uncultured Thermomicrobiales bacterium]
MGLVPDGSHRTWPVSGRERVHRRRAFSDERRATIVHPGV